MTGFRRKDALELGSFLFFMFGFSFLFNFFWEALHAVYLYESHDLDASIYVPMLLYVSSMDGLIILGLYIGVGAMWMNFFWIKSFRKTQLFVFAGIGVSIAAIIETLSVFYYHRWVYKKLMPTVFGIGISPLVQFSITGLLALWLNRELLYGRGLFRNRL